jgi:hypothetical protein
MDMQWYGLGCLVVILSFLAVAFTLSIRWFRSRSELRLREMEIRHRVLEKFADSQAFLDFVRSEEGRRLLLATPEPSKSARRTWLGLLNMGLLVFALGIGSGIAALRMPEGKEAWERMPKQNLATWGTLFTCAGIALMGSGALSRWLDRR